jgi:triosephosphate isomerase
VQVGAQNVHPKDRGAFTGEVSASMLLDAGARWVILGHSERRAMFGETDTLVAEKTRVALDVGLRPIVCVGELLEEREKGQTLDVVKRQLNAFASILADKPGVGAIAYEPVWAIGTGKTAGPAEAQEVHAMIRARLREISAEVAEKTRILYGGSMKASNAEGLLACEDVDGGLIGGASLKAEDFAGIALAGQKLA